MGDRKRVNCIEAQRQAARETISRRMYKALDLVNCSCRVERGVDKLAARAARTDIWVRISTSRKNHNMGDIALAWANKDWRAKEKLL